MERVKWTAQTGPVAFLRSETCSTWYFFFEPKSMANLHETSVDEYSSFRNSKGHNANIIYTPRWIWISIVYWIKHVCSSLGEGIFGPECNGGLHKFRTQRMDALLLVCVGCSRPNMIDTRRQHSSIRVDLKSSYYIPRCLLSLSCLARQSSGCFCVSNSFSRAQLLMSLIFFGQRMRLTKQPISLKMFTPSPQSPVLATQSLRGLG